MLTNAQTYMHASTREYEHTCPHVLVHMSTNAFTFTLTSTFEHVRTRARAYSASTLSARGGDRIDNARETETRQGLNALRPQSLTEASLWPHTSEATFLLPSLLFLSYTRSIVRSLSCFPRSLALCPTFCARLHFAPLSALASVLSVLLPACPTSPCTHLVPQTDVAASRIKYPCRGNGGKGGGEGAASAELPLPLWQGAAGGAWRRPRSDEGKPSSARFWRGARRECRGPREARGEKNDKGHARVVARLLEGRG